MKTKKIIEYIVSWLKIYIKKSNLKGFVIGISGGIDSAVTSVLLAKTKYPVLVIEIPINQEKSQLERSKEHVFFLKKKFRNVISKKINLSSIFENFCSLVKESKFDKKIINNKLKLTLANTKSRFRMILLYYYAGIYDYLVSGTGNKIEDFGVGFFTKYGDGASDINPIADLNKSQIYILASELNIIKSIQKALPTDGLWEDNRSDEDQLGVSYKDLEWAMININNIKNQKCKNIFSIKEKNIINIYKNLNKKIQHKIKPIPICKIPKILLN